MKTAYDLDDLLGSYVAAVKRPMYGVEAFRSFARHRSSCLARCFGVAFSDELCHTLDREAQLPHPFSGALEAGLLEIRFERELAALNMAAHDLIAFYRTRAREIALSHWGEVGTRTHDELLAAGFEPSRAPKLEDYIDEI